MRWMYFTDPHGNKIDPATRDAALRHRDAFKPDMVIHGGDNFDFAALRKGASSSEANESVRADVEAGVKFLRDFAPDVFLMGNHDRRVVETAAEHADGKVRDYCKDIHEQIMDECASLRCEVYAHDVFDGVFKWGGYSWIHNFNSPKHLAYQMGMQFGNSIGGHAHRFEECHPDREDRPSAYLCGCMMNIREAKYARHKTGIYRWQNGWMYGWMFDDNLVVQSVKRGPDGSFRIPTDFAEVA